ncbi:MAG TPA: peptidase dimerization domain-containing protein [Spirochaetales bacterium]|nr:peptidase dimerization domain-containing protein [Spirochaetales bacterium]
MEKPILSFGPADAEIAAMADRIGTIDDLVLGNTVMLGELPPDLDTVSSDETASRVGIRPRFFAERLSALGADEAWLDEDGHAVGLIEGLDRSAPPILLGAELDSAYVDSWEIHYAIDDGWITGPGLLDNALGASALLCVPDLLRVLGTRLQSDLIIVAYAGTMREGPMLGLVERFLSRLERKPRGALAVKGIEFGRLNYECEAVVRADLRIQMDPERSGRGNAIAVAAEFVDRVLRLRVPARPETVITIGTIEGGYKHGENAPDATVGFEVRSESNALLVSVMSRIASIVEELRYARKVEAEIRTGTKLGASGIGFRHPLVREALRAIKALGAAPSVYPSVSELHHYHSLEIPAVTIGIAEGQDYHTEHARARVASIRKGLAQMVSLALAIDGGACDA